MKIYLYRKTFCYFSNIDFPEKYSLLVKRLGKVLFQIDANPHNEQSPGHCSIVSRQSRQLPESRVQWELGSQMLLLTKNLVCTRKHLSAQYNFSRLYMLKNLSVSRFFNLFLHICFQQSLIICDIYVVSVVKFFSSLILCI